MTEWREVTIEELAEKIAMGPFGSDIKVETFKPCGVPIISGKHLHETRMRDKGFNFISEEHADKLSNANVFRGDVIFTHAGNIGQVSFIPENSKYERYVISQRQFYLRCNSNVLDYEFIAYYFKSPYGQYQLLANANQTGVPSLAQPVSYLKSIKVLLPPLTEQKAIAEVLSSLDDKIDLLTRQNKTLEDLAQAYFRKWFIEDASDKWEEIPLGQLFVISSGKGLKKEKFTEHGQYRVLGANGEIGKTNEYLFNERLIYTGRVGTLGNVFIVDREPVWLSDNTLVFRNIKYFFFVYFSLKWANLADYNVGSTQPLIRQSDIKEIRVFMPDKERLDSFENLANSIFAKINSNQKQIQLLQKLRDTLLPKLISGEIRVKM